MEPKKATRSTSAKASPSKPTPKVMTSADVSLQTARRLASEWKGIVSDYDPDELLSVICSIYQLSPDEVAGERKFARLLPARHLWYACLRHLCGWSFPMIGAFVGRDHTTVIRTIQPVPLGLVKAVADLYAEVVD
jgi:chromosomal replication initiation ATPase DnaA